MKEEILIKYNKLITEIWKYLKKYSTTTNTEEFWMNVRSEAHALAECFEVSPEYANDLAVATWKEIQRIHLRKEEAA